MNGCEVCECDYIGASCPYCDRKQLKELLVELFLADDEYGCGFYQYLALAQRVYGASGTRRNA